MALQKNLQRVKRMHEMIRYKRTGTPEQFATKMGISQSMLYYLIKELKDLGAPIVYCKSRQSYRYLHPVSFQIGFIPPSLTQNELYQINGGCSLSAYIKVTPETWRRAA